MPWLCWQSTRCTTSSQTWSWSASSMRGSAAVVIGVLVEIGFAILPDIPRELVGAEILFAPQRLEVSRKALVEPRVRPIAAGQQIAPPLMSELVRDQRIALE